MDKIRKEIKMKLGRKTEDKGGEQACQRKRQKTEKSLYVMCVR
jgi:hypothetical protein